MRITIVGAFVIVAGVIVAAWILERLLEKGKPQCQTETVPGGPMKIISSHGV